MAMEKGSPWKCFRLSCPPPIWWLTGFDLVVDRVDDAWRALREYESDPAGLKPTSSITQYALLVTLASVFYPHLLLPLNPSYFINAK
jgi:hypothetical protein